VLVDGGSDSKGDKGEKYFDKNLDLRSEGKVLVCVR
jgi:hypothetical protein